MVDEEKKSFGRVWKGDTVKIVYAVANKGNQPLIFTDWKVSCECTSAILPHRPLAPGDTASVLVTFDTGNAYGIQDRTVLIYTNAPSSPFKLRFRGNVRKR